MIAFSSPIYFNSTLSCKKNQSVILTCTTPADDAVNKPKFHHQWLPDSLYIEKSFSHTIRSPLEKMGYKLKERGGIGRTEVIKVLKDGRFEAVADGRGDDGAEGY